MSRIRSAGRTLWEVTEAWDTEIVAFTLGFWICQYSTDAPFSATHAAQHLVLAVLAALIVLVIVGVTVGGFGVVYDKWGDRNE